MESQYNPFESGDGRVASDYELIRRNNILRAIVDGYLSKPRCKNVVLPASGPEPDSITLCFPEIEQRIKSRNPLLGEFIWSIIQWFTEEPRFPDINPAENDENQIEIQLDAPLSAWSPICVLCRGRTRAQSIGEFESHVETLGHPSYTTAYVNLPALMKECLEDAHYRSEPTEPWQVAFERAPHRITLDRINYIAQDPDQQLEAYESLIKKAWVIGIDLRRISSATELREIFNRAMEAAKDEWEITIKKLVGYTSRGPAFQHLLDCEYALDVLEQSRASNQSQNVSEESDYTILRHEYDMPHEEAHKIAYGSLRNLRRLIRDSVVI